MLASWMRMKFPDQVQAAVVTGAPLLYYKDSPVPKTSYYHWVGKVYEVKGGMGGKCAPLITEGVDQLRLLRHNSDTYDEIADKFHVLCREKDPKGYFLEWILQDIQLGLTELTQYDWPHDSYQLG